MPFAGFPNFDACVSANLDKTDPKAFCAWLEHETTGKWPGQATMGMPKGIVETFWHLFESYMAKKKDEAAAMKFAEDGVSDLGWAKVKHGWTRRAEHKMGTRAVYGVAVFATGIHNGDPYSKDDLKAMCAAFMELTGKLDPPVKIGHTSDEFNKNLAEKMGIPAELIKGEAGDGVMAFGWVDDLRMTGDILYADLSDVPEPVAELIESKSYKKVSAEVLFDFEYNGKVYPRVLSGLALLGAELPAVRESGLETAAVYTAGRKPDKTVEFAIDTEELTYEQLTPVLGDIDSAIENTMKGRSGVGIIRAMWKEVKQKVKGMFEAKKHSVEDDDYAGTREGAIKGWLRSGVSGDSSLGTLSQGQKLKVVQGISSGDEITIVGKESLSGSSSEIKGTAKVIMDRPDANMKIIVIGDEGPSQIHIRQVSEGDIRISQGVRDKEHALNIEKITLGERKEQNIPPEIQAYADKEFQGNVDGLIQWVGQGGFNGCVSSLTGKEGITDPKRLCGWLKAQARERGVLSPAHQSLETEEEVEMKEVCKQLNLKEEAKEAEVVAAIKKLQDAIPVKGAENPLKPILDKLGLPAEATIDDILAKIDALTAAKPAGGGAPGMEMQFKNRIDTLETKNKTLERKVRKGEYKEQAMELTAISGAPDELAEELVSLEEVAGKEQAEKVLAKYKALNKRMVDAGIFKAKGTPAAGSEDDEHEFMKKVKTHMTEKHVEEPIAFDAVRKAEPELYKDFMTKRRVVTRSIESKD